MDTAAASEQFLLDVRMTIADLVNDHFFGTPTELAHVRCPRDMWAV